MEWREFQKGKVNFYIDCCFLCFSSCSTVWMGNQAPHCEKLQVGAHCTENCGRGQRWSSQGQDPPPHSTGKFCKTQRVPVTSKALSTHFVGSNTVSESLVWGWYTQAILPFSIFLLWTLLCFDCEMSPIGSYVWTLGGQLKVLLEKVITSLGDQI